MASGYAAPLIELARRGTRIDRFVVTASVRHARHATVLQARDGDGSVLALKLAATSVGGELIEREACVLKALENAPAPTPGFGGAGEVDGRPYLATSWLHGAEVRPVALELRDEGRRTDLIDLCRRIARAYASLHVDGVLHGHIHPRHVLADGDESIRLLDFSLTALSSCRPPVDRCAGRFNSLSAPEQAQSVLRAENVSLTAASEQYSVAALLYLLLTGRMYVRLRLARRDVARAILASAPLPFADHGLTPWPECEAVLGRALHKDPSQRYASMDGLAQALAAVPCGPASRARKQPTALAQSVHAPLASLAQAFRRHAYCEELLGRLSAPTCSINFGAAGVAFALTRLARLTGDATALEHAELWLSSAESSRGDADAFDDGDELTPDTVGRVSPYHCSSGLVAVRALLSEAAGDQARQQAALDEFRAATQAPCQNLDLTLGRSSVLLFAALLYTGAQPDWPSARRLASYGDELCAGIWRELERTVIPYNGIAHGWAGIAYATLMWAQARDVAPPPGTRDVLEMLSALAEPYERGVRWPLTSMTGPGSDEYWPGWCHGNAGYVFLWNLAGHAYPDGRFAELAERAVWLIDYTGGVTSLCCGAAGQAYAALNHYRSTGEEKWRSRALRIANRAASDGELAGDATTALSLYKGHVGLALLALELDCPERAAMPLFEFEPGRCAIAPGVRAASPVLRRAWPSSPSSPAVRGSEM